MSAVLDIDSRPAAAALTPVPARVAFRPIPVATVARFPHARRRAPSLAAFELLRGAVAAEPAPSGSAGLAEAPWSPASPFARDVLDGLTRPRKAIPCRWLHDARGSMLFERITRLPEYYLSRMETWILRSCAKQIAELAGAGASVIELGSGCSVTTPILLDALDAPAAYVPIDLCAPISITAAAALRRRWPRLRIEPLVGDFTQRETLRAAAERGGPGRRVVFFPGSTIGSFAPDVALGLLEAIAQAAGPEALLIVGVDATQDPALLLPACNDRQGVTAAFNKNLLRRINRELGADFSETAFRHEARFDARERRVEMHLVSQYTQDVSVLGRRFRFAMSESIHTQNAYKYALPRLQALAQRAGWAQRQLWVDAQARFAVHVLERSG